MTDLNKLIDIIRQSGYRHDYIAKKLGITVQSLINKLKGRTEFTMSEARELANLLHLTLEQLKEIFFKSEVPKNGDK